MKQLLELYLDYVNNFLTVARFAEYYNLTEKEALQVIEIGKACHERYVNRISIY